MVSHLEGEVALGAHLAPEHRHRLVAQRDVRVCIVRDLLALRLELNLERGEIAFDGGELLLERLAFFHERGAHVGLHLALHALGVGVALLADLVALPVERLVAIVRLANLGDVAWGRALVGVGLDGVGVLLDALEVDGGLPRERRGGGVGVGLGGDLGLLDRGGGAEEPRAVGAGHHLPADGSRAEGGRVGRGGARREDARADGRRA